MKILHVIDSGGFYGAEAMLVELALEQIKAGHSVTICSIGTPSEPEKPIEKVCKERGIKVYPLRMKAGLNLLGGMNIVNYAKQHGFDLFHSHGYKGNILLGILPKFIRAIPLVTTLHGWTSTSGLTKMRIYETLDALLLPRMDCVVLVSEAMLNRKEILGRKLNYLTVISNGISQTTPRVDSKDEIVKKIRSLKVEGPVIGSVGRLSYEKGYDVLLEAFKLIIIDQPKAILVIIGDGRLRQELEEQAMNLEVFKNIIFTGYLDNAGKYISEFDVYVNSSRTEGTPITLVECLRSGVKIVATNVGGNRTVLDDGDLGELVEECDAKLVANAIQTALTRESEELELKRKLYFKEHYSSEKMNANYEKAYKALVN
ncbi:glycosyltransferase [Alkalimarinus alittae]|uniref:Glycosyltransferase n=1 Tax=Alkalimarinus alittae TaxID=2961619 RepID=A0ABY6N799_9ALTE|nr:glycosyltransferase [Alkalimarinus alittae]UZE97971.1 glycosyltransferase [Alkalimarinus alittae]